MALNDKHKFLFKNLFKGFIWLILIVGLFILLSKIINPDYTAWLKPVYERPVRVYSIFLVSEVLFGIFPPEIFMIWALGRYDFQHYLIVVGLLTSISYLAGVLGFWFGRYLHTTRLYTYLRRVILKKYESNLHKYGLYLIIVAALTPIPYSAICMLVGAVDYPARKFYLYACSRFFRFAVYSLFVWESNALTT